MVYNKKTKRGKIMFENVDKFIEQTKMISAGDVIGVGFSGGSDSMALLHYLATNQQKFDIEVVAIHIDHGIRENSYIDADFAKEKAKELGVRFYKFRVDAPKLAKEKNVSIETAAREARYGVFKTLLRKGLVDKIALAHHMQDQAETILMHIFRGSGVAGAKGMEPIRENVYIRPMLTTSKEEINAYINEHDLDYREDETNTDTSYNRNFIRNVVMKQVLTRWPNAVKAIASFGQAVSEDDEYINKQLYADAVIVEGDEAKIPTSYFFFDKPIITRIIFKAFKAIGITKDIERKHIDMILDLAKNLENGKRISLPFDAVAIKEYDYVTIVNKHKEEIVLNEPFKSGEFEVEGFGKVIVKRVKDCPPRKNVLYIDFRKVPKTAVWRFRQEGDVFEKFGGGSKKLKAYLIDKKIPLRERKVLPVLADGNEVYVIAGVEISNKVRVTDAPTACMIEVKKD